HRFPATDLAGLTGLPHIKLAVESGLRLVGDHLETVASRLIAKPLGRLEPDGMPWTVVVGVALDGRREDLDEPRGSRQWPRLGVGTELAEQDLVRVHDWNLDALLGPEVVEARDHVAS